MSSTELEVTPNLEVRLVVEPRGGQSSTEERKAGAPVSLVGFEFDHEDEVDGNVPVYSSFN